MKVRGNPFICGQVPWNKSIKIKKVCLCGRDFEVVPSRTKTAKYCSYPCKQKWQVTLNNPAKDLVNREKISKKLKGRTAYWLYGDKNPSCRSEVKKKLSERAKARWADGSWVQSMLHGTHWFGRSVESKKHVELKFLVGSVLQELGFRVKIEVPVRLANNLYVLDVVGYSTKTVVVECGGCRKAKLVNLRNSFDLVIHLPYSIRNVRSYLLEELCVA